ncbi:ewing's tumor-associated antigen 1-like protein [Huso huso]|uniref:Ewing's tumor-associated antigen 1-like protein n=1 Tax=Huso huso TaxID=61971 RepID=A0ABR0ZVD7_HUSHU
MTKRRRHFGALHLAALEIKKENPKDRRRSNKSKTNKLSRGLLYTQFSPSSTKSEDEKTPKRYLRTSHHTSSYAVSPCNDNELHFQQDIFWDPTYSPAKFGKGENKLAVSGHAVEISDIVNRIAPKDEKPAGPEVPLLEMWIGDNAIPCTPEVLRARPKKNSFRSSGVEDLLKLAKQFDRHMIQQDGEQYHDKDLENIFQHENEDQMESDMHEKGLPPLGELTGMKNSSFNSKDAGIQEEIQIKNSSQKSVDQEAEADINALFDGPTQPLSGRLSQTSSKSSHSSPERKCMFGAETNKVTKKSTCEGGVNFKFNKPPGFGIKPNSYQNTTQQCAVKRTTVSSSKPTVNGSEMASKSPVSSVSTNDFDDDWGSDDLLDDSLVLEITQNPELIATPKGTHCSKQTGASITPNYQSVSGEETNKCIEHGSSVSSMLHSGLTSESRQCGIDINPGEFQRINLAFEKVRNRASFMLHKNSQVQAGETSAENISKQTDFCASNKPEIQKDLHQQKVYTNETRFNKGSPSTPYKNIHNFQQVESGSSTHKPFKQQIATSSDSKSVNQSVKCQEISVEAPKQTTSLVDDWNESRFSDGVLTDALDECGNLWGDDDLFYQVCDDVEKLAEAQSTGLGTNIAPSSVKRNNSQPVTYPNKIKSGSATSAVQGMSAQSSYAAPENRNQNRSVGNSTNKPPATFNQANSFSTTFGNDSSINATSSLNQKTYTLNANSNQSVFVPSVNNNKSNTSKYVFTKLRSTCVEVSEEQCSQMTGLASGNRTYMQSYNKGTVQSHQSSSGITGASFKRHLSDSIALTSSKVFVTNQQNVKCSEEEIEKKKREALARRMARQRDQ